jgi:hypothetical protein
LVPAISLSQCGRLNRDARAHADLKHVHGGSGKGKRVSPVPLSRNIIFSYVTWNRPRTSANAIGSSGSAAAAIGEQMDLNSSIKVTSDYAEDGNSRVAHLVCAPSCVQTK